MGKKKQLKRQFKKGLKFLRKSIADANPRLTDALAGGGSMLVAAALDPKVQESAKALALAIGDFLKRSAAGESSTSFDHRAAAEQGDSAYEHH